MQFRQFFLITAHQSQEYRGDGVRMYLQKNDRCFSLTKDGMGMRLTPRPRLAGIRGDGIYLRAGFQHLRWKRLHPRI